jgi:hypothetical protein
MNSIRQFLLAAVLLATVGACSSSDTDDAAPASPSVDEETTTTIEEAATTASDDSAASQANLSEQRYESVEAMRDVLEATGFPCSLWEVLGQGNYGVNAAVCTRTELFVLYDDPAEIVEHAEVRAETINEVLDQDAAFVVGANWSVTCGGDEAQLTCAELADRLSGTVLAFPAN